MIQDIKIYAAYHWHVYVVHSTNALRINESRLFLMLIESLQVSISSTCVLVDGHCGLQGFEYELASRSAKNVARSLLSLAPW